MDHNSLEDSGLQQGGAREVAKASPACAFWVRNWHPGSLRCSPIAQPETLALRSALPLPGPPSTFSRSGMLAVLRKPQDRDSLCLSLILRHESKPKMSHPPDTTKKVSEKCQEDQLVLGGAEVCLSTQTPPLANRDWAQ